MPPQVASLGCYCLIAGLFWLNRDKDAKTSPGLWLPIIWFALACSRSAGQWLQLGPPVDSAADVAEGSPIDRVVYLVLIVIAIGILASRGRRVGQFLRSNAPILIFLCYCLFSLLWSDYPDVAVKRWIKAVGDVAMVLIVLTDEQPINAIKRLLSRVAYFLIPLSILFIKYYPDLGMEYGPWGGNGMFTGVAGNKNALGVICLCLGVGALWRLITDYQNRDLDGRKRKLLAQSLLLLMIFWLFWVSNSMTSLNSFVMAGLILIAANSRSVIRNSAKLHILIVSMLTVSASVVFLDISPDILIAMGRNPTLTDRTEVWGILRGLAGNPLIGVGFESFWLGKRLDTLWSIYWWHPNEAHNGYLEIFLQVGWIGIALLGVVVITGYRTALRRWRGNTALGSLCLAYFFIALVYNFTEAAWFKILAPAWLFFLLGTVDGPILQTQTADDSLLSDSSSLSDDQPQSALREELV